MEYGSKMFEDIKIFNSNVMGKSGIIGNVSDGDENIFYKFISYPFDQLHKFYALAGGLKSSKIGAFMASLVSNPSQKTCV